MATLRILVAWLGGRRGVIIAGLAGWAVLIGIGAGRTPDESRWIGLPPLEWFVFAFAGLTVLVGLSLLVAMIAFRGEGESTPPPKKSWWPAVALLLLLVVLSLRGPREEQDEVAEDPVVATEEPSTEASRQDAVVSGQELVALLVILAAAVSVVVWTRRRVSSTLRATTDDGDPTLEADLAPAVAVAAEHLRLGRDPRSSVLVAYAGLEDALAARGFERVRVETPTEHLRRTLANLTIDSAPLLQLAALYELARFSDHAISSADQRTAADSLTRVRDELGAAGLSARSER